MLADCIMSPAARHASAEQVAKGRLMMPPAWRQRSAFRCRRPCEARLCHEHRIVLLPAGSWLKDVPPEDGTAGADTEAAARLGNALRGSQGLPLEYGPQAPPQRGWDMRDEVREENAARAAAGAPLATNIASAPAADAVAPGAAPAGAPAWQDDARYTQDTPYSPRASMGHFDPMHGNGADDGGLETADAVRALASGLGMDVGDAEEEFPWLEQGLGAGSGAGSADASAPAQTDGAARDVSGRAAHSADDFDIPGWKFDGFEGMGSGQAAAAVAGPRPEDRTDSPLQVDEADINEQVPTPPCRSPALLTTHGMGAAPPRHHGVPQRMHGRQPQQAGVEGGSCCLRAAEPASRFVSRAASHGLAVALVCRHHRCRRNARSSASRPSQNA